MKSNIKLIVSDIDHTLLDQNGHLTAYTKHALIGYQKQGYILMLATGRFYHEANDIVEMLQMKTYNGYIACCNGAQVIRLNDQHMHVFDMISKNETMYLLQIARKYKLTIYLNDEEDYYLHVARNLMKVSTFARKTAAHIDPILPSSLHPYLQRLIETNITASSFEKVPDELSKICFIGTPKQLQAYRKEIHQLYPHTYNFFHVNEFAIEIVKRNVSKAHAVDYVCKELGISMQEVIAFGDSGNDEPLLEKAGIGVAMKNGFRSARKKADYISLYTNHQDGVVRTLQAMLKGKM